MARPEVKRIAEAFVKRAIHHNLRGKRRDELAVEFFLGAVTGLKVLAGDDEKSEAGKLCNRILMVVELMVLPRGYAAVLELAEWPGKEAT